MTWLKSLYSSDQCLVLHQKQFSTHAFLVIKMVIVTFTSDLINLFLFFGTAFSFLIYKKNRQKGFGRFFRETKICKTCKTKYCKTKYCKTCKTKYCKTKYCKTCKKKKVL